MIYNMVTLSIQLLLIGFTVGVVAFYFVPQGRSQLFSLELVLSVLGAFLGTVVEVALRSIWTLPLLYHLIGQFAIPLAVSIACVVVYRLSNSFRD